MITEKQMIKIARRYFWQQKRAEVAGFFKTNGYFFLYFSLIIGMGFQLGWQINSETGLPHCKAIAIVGLCILGFWVLIGLILLIKVIIKWIKSNWKTALTRARDESTGVKEE